ncbi:Phosphoglycerate transport system sensor protein pgtB [Raoultella planticola]|nr:Phosphoglycerate transport system sensor protein pgtB [Raoultella planticola]
MRLPGFIRNLTISASLRGAFLTGALLTLVVSGVSLYSWHEQSSQIRYALNDYFPRIQTSFLIENSLNTLVDQLNEFFTGGQYHLAPAITQPDPATPG